MNDNANIAKIKAKITSIPASLELMTVERCPVFLETACTIVQQTQEDGGIRLEDVHTYLGKYGKRKLLR